MNFHTDGRCWPYFILFHLLIEEEEAKAQKGCDLPASYAESLGRAEHGSHMF